MASQNIWFNNAAPEAWFPRYGPQINRFSLVWRHRAFAVVPPRSLTKSTTIQTGHRVSVTYATRPGAPSRNSSAGKRERFTPSLTNIAAKVPGDWPLKVAAASKSALSRLVKRSVTLSSLVIVAIQRKQSHLPAKASNH